MSTYEPGRLYLIDHRGVTCAVHYCVDGFFRMGGDFEVSAYRANLNVRPAIVLDPEGEDVKAFTDPRHDPADYAVAIAVEIRAQITPPEPPMEEPTEWGEAVTDDRGDWMRSRRWRASAEPWAARLSGEWSSWDNMQNPRPYNPEEN